MILEEKDLDKLTQLDRIELRVRYNRILENKNSSLLSSTIISAVGVILFYLQPYLFSLQPLVSIIVLAISVIMSVSTMNDFKRDLDKVISSYFKESKQVIKK